MRALLTVVVLAALAACHSARNEQTSNQQVAPADSVKGVKRSHSGTHAPAVTFVNADGEPVSLSQFAGKPTLINLWASWCAPCVKELPTLDRLARSQGNALNVVAISQDMGPRASVVAFLQAHHIASLEPYQDPRMALSGALDAEILPSSVLYDANGREVWRYVGDLDWTGSEAAKLIAEGGAPKSTSRAAVR